MVDDVYLRLREFLDRMPGGFPETESGIEIRILEKLFTPEEAGMALRLNGYPETVPAIAERAGIDETGTAEMLESMARQGSILRMRHQGRPYYMATSFLVGIYEFHLKSMDAEFAGLMSEYEPYLTEFWSKIKTKQLRVVPVGEALETDSEVATYNRIRNMVDKYEDIAVADCICRVERGLHGHQCERPLETCLVFGVAAQYYCENGIGRKISVEECHRILDKAEDAALVLCPSNAQDIVNICCCCACCCGMIRSLRTYERPADHVLSSYRAAIDPELCTLCGTCEERCQIEAVIERDGFMEVDTARCIGCGLCVPTCPENAVTMVRKPVTEVPPANIVEMNLNILKERGLA